MPLNIPEKDKIALKAIADGAQAWSNVLTDIWTQLETERLVNDSEQSVEFSLELTLAGGCLDRAISHLRKCLTKC